MTDFFNFIKGHKKILSLPSLVIIFLMLRIVFGPQDLILYSFCIALVILRIPMEKGAMIFLVLAIALFTLGQVSEANRYVSFVFGFMVLYLVLGYKALVTKHTDRNK